VTSSAASTKSRARIWRLSMAARRGERLTP
jgi:hypothetical protein